MRVLPLRPEQRGLPLAEIRWRELQRMSEEDMAASIKLAQAASFSSPKELGKHFHKHRHDLGVASEQAHAALLERVLADPQRAFSVYYDRLDRPAIRQWVFAREDILVIVGQFDENFVVTTMYRTRIEGNVIDLSQYLVESDYGEQLVEIDLS